MTRRDRELRDRFRYKKFRLSSDGSVIFFDLTRVFRDGDYIGEYFVKDDKGEYKMTFNPPSLGPFQNIWVITEKGEKILLNTLVSRLMSGDTITLTQILDDDIPDDIKGKLDELYSW